METATSLGPSTGASQSPEILFGVRISDVYRALGGPQLRRCGPEKYRGAGWWRGGDGPDSVSLNNVRSVWHDFVTGRGGGILDLIVEVRGGDRQEALRWLADLAGIALEDTPLSAADRARWAAERRELERHLPAAGYWRRLAVGLCEEALHDLKAVLFDPTADPLLRDAVLDDAIYRQERMLNWFGRIDGLELVGEYSWWRQHHPALTGGMVAAARSREKAEVRALLRYLDTLEEKAE